MPVGGKSMRKHKGIFSVILCSLLLCTSLKFPPVYAQETSEVITRLSGSDRYATSVAISQHGWTESTTVIIATGLDYPDALAASSLAKSKGAPILLTEKNELRSSTIDEIKRLKASQAILVGGIGVISAGVENQLKGLNLSITRIGGNDRYDTSKKVAELMGVDKGIIVATGANFPDALSIAPIAGIKSMPILLSPKNSLDPNVAEFIKGKNIPVSYIVGGTGVLDNQVASSVPNSNRLSGVDRYATNLRINTEFSADLNFDTVYLATGRDFPDALGGSALAAKNNAPIFLTDKDSISSATLDFMKSKNVRHVVILGGTGVVSQNVENSVKNNINKRGYVDNLDFDYLKVRAIPSIVGNDPIGKLYYYDRVEIVDTVVDTTGRQWYKIVYNGGYAYVFSAYIVNYTSPPDNVVDIARNITTQFEFGNMDQIAGNFDGVGLSLGYLQWNIGQGELQRLLARMDCEYNSIMRQTFGGTSYDSIHGMLAMTKEQQLQWAISINDAQNNIKAPWYGQLVNLTKTPEFIKIEKDAEVVMINRAMNICDKYKLRTVRGFALAFDIATQNGSISSGAGTIIDNALKQKPNMMERELLQVIANAVADTAAGNVDDTRSRKMAIVNGSGTVHEIPLNLDAKYGLSDSYWR